MYFWLDFRGRLLWYRSARSLRLCFQLLLHLLHYSRLLNRSDCIKFGFCKLAMNINSIIPVFFTDQISSNSNITINIIDIKLNFTRWYCEVHFILQKRKRKMPRPRMSENPRSEYRGCWSLSDRMWFGWCWYIVLKLLCHVLRALLWPLNLSRTQKKT